MAPTEVDPAVRSIADRIKELRVKRGLTQDQFAHMIGVTRSHLSDVETYRVEPSWPVVLGVLGLHIAGSPAVFEEGDVPAWPGRPRTPEAFHRPIDANWLILGPAPAVDDYRPSRRTRQG